MDSGWIECDDVTTLVGINEAGKSNVILALWKLKPARNEGEAKIDILHDMPNTRYTEWRNQAEKIWFIRAVFDIDREVKQLFENAEIKGVDNVYVSRSFKGNYCVKYTPEGGKETIVEDAELKEAIIKSLPYFVYYSNYGNLDAEIYLPHAVTLLNGKAVPGYNNPAKVRTLRVLFDFVGLDAQEVLELGENPVKHIKDYHGRVTNNEPTEQEIEAANKKKEERRTLLNSASSKLTKEFANWWRQGNYKFRLDADGDYFRIWVSDEVRTEEIQLERRSTGLQWFLSFFLVFLVESEGEHEGAVLLLDEAGLTLHPMAQKDLVSFFEGLSENNQIIHTTHSPFLVDTNNVDRVKVVYSNAEGHTVVSSNLREADDKSNEKSIYPVHAALGLSVSDILMNGCQPVVVEGASDQYYLNAIKLWLIKKGEIKPNHEILFIPAGGCKSKSIKAIASILSSKHNDLPYVLLDSDKIGESARKDLTTELYKGKEKRIIGIADIVGYKESEIEDLIPHDFITAQLNKWFGNCDEDFEPDREKPVIPQIEEFSRKNSIALPSGWKVMLAQSVKKQIQRQKSEIADDYLSKWIELFELISVK